MRYYSTQRPITPGVLTSGAMSQVTDIVNYDRRSFVPEINGYAWGHVDTKNQLSISDIDRSDLTANRFWRLSADVRERLCDCVSILSDIPKIAGCFYDGEDAEDALIQTLEHLEANSQYFDLTDDQWTKMIAMIENRR